MLSIDKTKIKIVLQSEDGSTNHMQAYLTVNMDDDASIANHQLVRWNDKNYCFNRTSMEHRILVAFFNECGEPYEITEF